jgi:hypothetical protein
VRETCSSSAARASVSRNAAEACHRRLSATAAADCSAISAGSTPRARERCAKGPGQDPSPAALALMVVVVVVVVAADPGMRSAESSDTLSSGWRWPARPSSPQQQPLHNRAPGQQRHPHPLRVPRRRTRAWKMASARIISKSAPTSIPMIAMNGYLTLSALCPLVHRSGAVIP